MDNLDKIDKIDEIDTKEISLDSLFDSIHTTLQENKLNTIRGEIITFKYSDCHAYITLKSESYQLSCIFWKITLSKNYNEYKNIKEGDQVKLDGFFSLNKRNFNIYFNVKNIEKVGLGNYLMLHKKFRNKIIELKMNENKKKLIIFPYNIGIITALEGAAIQDILQTFKLDHFKGNIYIKNTLVQGKQCPQSIVSSIEYFENSNNIIDLLLITRGGGSYEDLIGFSNWDVIDKVYNCKYITISAVGHQIDNQLTDEVADYKMATPSIAAKYITETQHKYINMYENMSIYIKNTKEQYNNSRKHFNYVRGNYKKLIKLYDIKEMREEILSYSMIIKPIITKYNNAKNVFFNKLTNIKPTIYKEGKEITSICNFIDISTNKEISPKKIEIILPDGKVILYYKLIEYEYYN